MPFYIEFYERTGSIAGACMHDPLALARDRSVAGDACATRVEVELDGTWTRGMTVTDLRGIRRSPWPAGWERRRTPAWRSPWTRPRSWPASWSGWRSLVGARA